MGIVDVAKIIAVLIAAVGLFLNAIQIMRSTQQRRYEQMATLLQRIFDNSDINEFYYKLEYGVFNYDDNFHGSDDERKLDQLLRYFELAAKLYLANYVKSKELELIKYEYLVIYQNSDVQEYLKFLDKLFGERGLKQRPFDSFRKVGATLGCCFD